jgi:hypothetical protein
VIFSLWAPSAASSLEAISLKSALKDFIERFSVPPPPPLPIMPTLLMPTQDANSPSSDVAAVTEELPYPTVEPRVAEKAPCPTEEPVGSEDTEDPEMEEEQNAPNQISLSFIEGEPRPSTSQHHEAKHGSNPPQDQGARLSDMFEEMNVDNEPLFVVNLKTLNGAVGPTIGIIGHQQLWPRSLYFSWTGMSL